MSTQKTKRIPTPIYAAAGAGDLAYQKLRTLPARMAELREKAAERYPTVAEEVKERAGTVRDHDMRADLERLRQGARRNAAVVMKAAQAAQERAAVVYGDLVTRGEQVVRTMRAEPVPQDAPTTEITAPTTAEIAAAPVAETPVAETPVVPVAEAPTTETPAAPADKE